MDERSDEKLVEWIASCPNCLKKVPSLTTEQKNLGMSEAVVIIANKVFNFDRFNIKKQKKRDTKIFQKDKENRFARMQLVYHKLFLNSPKMKSSKNLNNRSLFHLSPRMEIEQESDRIYIKEMFMKYLEKFAREAALELERLLSQEQIEVDRRLENKKVKKKTIEPLKTIKNADEDQKCSTVNKQYDNGRNESVPVPGQQQEESKELQVKKERYPTFLSKSKVIPRKEYDDIATLCYTSIAHAYSHRTQWQQVQQDRKLYTDSIQHVQLKAFIAESKANAAQERSNHLEQLLKRVMQDENVTRVMNQTLKEEIFTSL